MYEQVEKSKENKSRVVANSVGQKVGKWRQGLVDNRKDSTKLGHLINLANDTPKTNIANREVIARSMTLIQPISESVSKNTGLDIGREPIQRALALDATATSYNRVVVNDNRPWVAGLAAAMPVGSTQDRCHVISFEQIRLGVWQALIEFMYGVKSKITFKNSINRLVSAVFPNAGTAGTHASTALNNIASTLHSQITTDLANIIAASGTTAEAKRISLADNIVLCMNSSPDNLRPADKTTNQSIGSDLDPRGSDIKAINHTYLGNIFEISGTTAKQLLALNLSERKRIIEVWKDSNNIQNSESVGVTLSSMTGGGRPIYLKNGTNLESLH